jgi:hypothetical protein
MKNKLRFGFQSIFGIYLSIGIIILDLILSFSRQMPYIGESLFTVRWFAIDLFIICPVVAGVVATDTSRFSKKENVYLTNIKKHKQYKWILKFSALPPALSHLIIPIIYLFIGHETDLPKNILLSVILGLFTQFLIIYFFGVFGFFLGKFLPVTLSGIVAVILSVFLYFKGTSAGLGYSSFTIFGDDGASVSQIGKEFRVSYLIIRIIILLIAILLLFHSNFMLNNGNYIPKIKTVIYVVVIVIIFIVPSVKLQNNPLITAKNVNYNREYRVAGVKIYWFKQHDKYAQPYIDFYNQIFSTLKTAGYKELLPKSIYEGVGSSLSKLPIDASITMGGYNDMPQGINVVGDPDFGVLSEDMIDNLIILPRAFHCKQMIDEYPPLKSNSNGDYILDNYQDKLYETIMNISKLDDGWKGAKVLKPKQVNNILEKFKKCKI